MATVLDFSILSSLSIIFIFIAVFIAGWGISMFINPFGLKDKGSQKKIYAVLAFALSFIVVLSKPVLGMIAFSIPWFSVIMMVGFFMLFFAKMFNPDLDTADLIGDPVVYGFLIFFVSVTVLFAFGSVMGQDLLEKQPGVSDADQITGEAQPTDEFVPAEEATEPGTLPEQQAEGEAQPPTTGSTAQNSFGENLALTLFHPKILGMLFMMLLGTITILLIAR